MVKKAFFLLLPVATLLSPVAFYSAPGWWSKMTANLQSMSSSEASHQVYMAGHNKPTGGQKTSKAPDGQPASVHDAPVHDLTGVLRFDVSPSWVVTRWPRVSTGLSQLQLQGYRVPLVTGTAEDDVAGALTYYFNPRQQVQRLTFHGTTGNAQKLVHYLSTRFSFRRRLTNDPGVFLYETVDQKGNPTSFLWIRPAGVVQASKPLERFEVALVMERPPTG